MLTRIGVGIVSLSIVVGVAHAQQTGQPNDAWTNWPNHRIRVTPSLTHVDPRTRTATLEFINPSDDTVRGTITVGISAPEREGNTNTPSSMQASGLIANDSSMSTAASMADTVGSTGSLVSWIRGVPAQMVLAPHEKKSVTIQLVVPPNVRPGDYAAWVVTTTDPGVVPPMTGTAVSNGAQYTTTITPANGGHRMGKDGKPLRFHEGGKIVYTVSQ